MESMVSMLKLSHVPRWSIVDTIKTQSVADHSFRVAAITKYIAEELKRLYNTRLDIDYVVCRALMHDIEESRTGDMPCTRKYSDVNDIKDNIARKSLYDMIIKLADTIEAIVFIKRYGVKPDRVVNELYSKVDMVCSLISSCYGVCSEEDVRVLSDLIIERGEDYV